MQDHPKAHIQLAGEMIAELLDQNEYHSNVDNVAAVSSEQICLLRRVKHELVPFKLEYFDVNDCKAIEYVRDTAYYRIVAGVVCFAAAVIIAYILALDPNRLTPESGPLIALGIGLVTFGIRFITSIHRHILRFALPGRDTVLEITRYRF